MSNQPPVGVFKKVYPPQGGIILQAVPEREWTRFSNSGDAVGLAEAINAALPGQLTMSLTPYIDAEESLGYYILNPGGVRMYAISGTLADGTPFYVDTVGEFLDRKANPNPFLDRNPDTSLGGPNLVLQQIAPGFTTLRWGK